MRKTETTVEHYSGVNIKMHDVLMTEFMTTSKDRVVRTIYDKEGSEVGEVDQTVDVLTKLSSSIGYLQQVQTSLTKNLYIEKHIKEINTKLDRIPPEILQSMMSPKVLEPIET